MIVEIAVAKLAGVARAGRRIGARTVAWTKPVAGVAQATARGRAIRGRIRIAVAVDASATADATELGCRLRWLLRLDGTSDVAGEQTIRVRRRKVNGRDLVDGRTANEERRQDEDGERRKPDAILLRTLVQSLTPQWCRSVQAKWFSLVGARATHADVVRLNGRRAVVSIRREQECRAATQVATAAKTARRAGKVRAVGARCARVGRCIRIENPFGGIAREIKLSPASCP